MFPEMIPARASTPASPGLTRGYEIKYKIARRYRFPGETILPKAYFWACLFLLLGLGYEGHTRNEKGLHWNVVVASDQRF
jgi:hypothetical protein